MVDEKQVLDGFLSGICCSMLVFGEAAHGLGIDEVTARKIASCFGSGMEHAGLCGCVTGAYMALGLKYGNGAPGEVEKIARLKEKKAEFERRFVERWGSLECTKMLGGLDPADPKELQAAAECGLFARVCAPAVCSACEILKELERE